MTTKEQNKTKETPLKLKKSKEGKGSKYKKVLTALITSDDFLSAFRNQYDSDFFEASFAQKLCQLCFDFYDNYEESPKSHIQDLYEELVMHGGVIDSELELIENLLVAMSEDFDAGEEINVKYMMEMADKIQFVQDIEFLKEELEIAVQENNIKHMQELLDDFHAFEKVDDIKFTQPVHDTNSVEKALKACEPPLFTLKSDMGDLSNCEFYRGSFVSIRAPAGTGKTWALTDLGIMSALARRNTVIFQMGDLSENQFYSRIWTMLSGIPSKPLYDDYKVPYLDCLHNQRDYCVLADSNRVSIGKSIRDANGFLVPNIPENYTPCTWCAVKNKKFPATILQRPYKEERVFNDENLLMAQKLFKERVKENTFFNLTVPTRSYNVSDIERRLKELNKEFNFIPEVVVLDYTDIMAKDSSGDDERISIQTRYSLLRRLSLKWNICLIVGEQSDAGGYDNTAQKMDNFAGSRTKNDEITAGFGVSQTPEEREQKIFRWNKFKSRENECNPLKEVVVTTNFACGVVHSASIYKHKLGKEDNIEELDDSETTGQYDADIYPVKDIPVA